MESAVEITYNMGGIDKMYFYLKRPQLKIIHMEKYITIFSIQLLNYLYILLKHDFIKTNRLLDKSPSVNWELSVTEL